jgi:hypothetical protein
MTRNIMRAALCGCAIIALSNAPAMAHGIAGDRVFPATLTIDDPAVGDELSLPTIDTFSSGDTGAGDGYRQHDYGFEWDKTITKDFGFGINDGYTVQDLAAGGQLKGWNDVSLTLKWNNYTNPEHEFMTSLGVVHEFGSTGSAQVDDRSGYTQPTFYFGKGLGDMPIGYLRPLAITGEASYSLQDAPNVNANSVNLGFSVQYSMSYLHNQVKDLGLPEVVNNIIPIVEVNLSQNVGPLGNGARMGGTVAPGLLYEGDTWQVGAEALIPVNKATNQGGGFIVQFHLFLDDILPNTLGKPLFGGV